MSSLITSDGLRLSARRWPARKAGSATVVLVHGFSASKDNPEVVAVAEALVEEGFGVVSYDGRGHCHSEGLCTLGDAERHDVAAAVEVARTQSERVVTVGASMGAIAVLRHAGSDALLDGAVAVSAPAVWRLPRNVSGLFSAGLTRTRLGRWLAERHLDVRIDPVWSDPPPPLAVAADIRSPLAVIHGDKDRMIPSSEAPRLVESAGGPTRLDIVQGMGHAFHVRSIPAVVAAVRWALAKPEHVPA